MTEGIFRWITIHTEFDIRQDELPSVMTIYSRGLTESLNVHFVYPITPARVNKCSIQHVFHNLLRKRTSSHFEISKVGSE